MKCYAIALLLVCAITVVAQQPTDLPTYGSIDLIKQHRRVYVAAEISDSRSRVIKALRKDRSLEIMDSPDGAEFFIEYSELSREVAVTGSRTKERQERSEMRAFLIGPDKRKTIVWSESRSRETQDFLGMKMYDSGHSESELVKRFLKALKKARG